MVSSYRIGRDKNRVHVEGSKLWRDTPVCDFCHAPDYCGYFRIPPGKVDIGELPDGRKIVDDGQWAACETCAGMLQRGWWDELKERAIEFQHAKTGIPKWHVRKLVTEELAQLRRVWTGEFIIEQYPKP